MLKDVEQFMGRIGGNSTCKGDETLIEAKRGGLNMDVPIMGGTNDVVGGC